MDEKYLKQFKDLYCKDCKAPCEEGIVENYEDLRCLDRDIIMQKRRDTDEKQK